MMSFLRFPEGVLVNFDPDCFCTVRFGKLYSVSVSGRSDAKSGCAFLCDDVLGRNCMLDAFAGGVLLRFLAAASTIAVTLSRGDCLSWGKAFPGIRGCMSN